jgi:transposase
MPPWRHGSCPNQPVEISMSDIVRVGVDLAKNLFQVHGVDRRGKPVVKKQLQRDQVLEFFANMPPCLIGMEACSGAHPPVR